METLDKRNEYMQSLDECCSQTTKNRNHNSKLWDTNSWISISENKYQNCCRRTCKTKGNASLLQCWEYGTVHGYSRWSYRRWRTCLLDVV